MDFLKLKHKKWGVTAALLLLVCALLWGCDGVATPPDTPLTDSVTGAVYTPSYTESDEMWMYNYRRLVFDGVEITDDTSLTVNIYAGDEKITWQQIHHKDQNAVNEEFRLSRKDKAALTEK